MPMSLSLFDRCTFMTKIKFKSPIVFIRAVPPLVRLLNSSRWRDFGRCLRDLVRGRGLARPCSSISACCFLCRYSCFISSRRAFSSSLRMRSSSALRLGEKQRTINLMTNLYFYNPFFSEWGEGCTWPRHV